MLRRKGNKSRTVRITPILICPLTVKSRVLVTVRRVHYGKMVKSPTTFSGYDVSIFRSRWFISVRLFIFVKT